MSEIFNNYLTKKNYPASQSTSITIVPSAGSELTPPDNNSVAIGSRTENSVAQLHSIYITKESDSAEFANNPLDNKSYISLYVHDTSSSSNDSDVYIAQNVIVLPYSSFYIEKTITLKAQQELKMEYTSLNTKAGKLSTVCSCVDIV